jgi:hypothetical protein
VNSSEKHPAERKKPSTEVTNHFDDEPSKDIPPQKNQIKADPQIPV